MIKQIIKTQTLYNCLGWGLAIILSGILNLFLFGIMPGMIQKVPQKPGDLDDIRAIQVVRIKRHESPVRKKQKKKPEKLNKKPKEIKNRVKVYKQRPLVLKPRLPFELNSKLPNSINSLKMPPLEHFSLNAQTGFFAENELDSPLTPLAKIPPIYPLRAVRRGIEGWVRVKFIVNTSGLVENLEVLESKPVKIFNRSVINCVSQWKFKPGRIDGVPVLTRAETTIRFELE